MTAITFASLSWRDRKILLAASAAAGVRLSSQLVRLGPRRFPFDLFDLQIDKSVGNRTRTSPANANDLICGRILVEDAGNVGAACRKGFQRAGGNTDHQPCFESEWKMAPCVASALQPSKISGNVSRLVPKGGPLFIDSYLSAIV